MFHVRCTTHGRTELLSAGSMLSVHRTASGQLAYYRCPCGRVGWMLEGSGVDPELRAGRCA